MEPLKTTEEIADYLRVEVVTVRRLAARGELPAYRVGSEFRFMGQEIQDYVKSQRVRSPIADRFDKFTTRARKVLEFSTQEATERGHEFVGTEHLLLGLLRESEGVAASALIRAGLQLDEVRQRTLDVMEQRQQQSQESPAAQVKATFNAFIRGSERAGRPSGERGLTARVKRAIQLAAEEARQMGHHYIGTEHLLLGLIQERQGVAGEVLVDQCGLTLETMRALVLQILNETSTMSLPEIPEQAATLLSENEQGVTCGRCGAQSPEYFRYCFHCGLKLPSHESESPSRLSE